MKSHRYFYKSCIISCMCCCLIALSGCRSEMMNNSSEKGDVSSESYEIDNTPIKTMLKNTPKHIKKSLGENISIDAEVIVPEVKEAPIFIGKHILFDDNYFVDKFFKDRNPETKESENSMITESDKIKAYRIDDELMIIRSGSVIYTKEEKLKKYNLATYSRFINGISDVYSNGELDFMSREEAINHGKEILIKNRISIYGEPKIYALTAEKMQEEQDKLICENEGIKKIIESGIMKKQDKFIKYDECYVLSFRGEVNNIPITRDFYIDEVSDKTIGGMRIEVWIDKEGIIDLVISNAFENINEVENPENLLSVDEAIYKLKQRYDSKVMENKINFNEITLEYVGVPYEKKITEIKFIPTWCFKKKEGRLNEENYMRVNAVTGEVF